MMYCFRFFFQLRMLNVLRGLLHTIHSRINETLKTENWVKYVNEIDYVDWHAMALHLSHWSNKSVNYLHTAIDQCHGNAYVDARWCWDDNDFEIRTCKLTRFRQDEIIMFACHRSIDDNAFEWVSVMTDFLCARFDRRFESRWRNTIHMQKPHQNNVLSETHSHTHTNTTHKHTIDTEIEQDSATQMHSI